MKNAYLFLVLLLLFAQPSHALNTKAAGMEDTTPGAAMTSEGGKDVPSEPGVVAAPAAQTPLAAPAAAPAQGAAPAKAGGCADDERLLTIGQWLGGPPQNPPVTISPESFILMDQEVVALLGGQAVVCPNVPLLKGGKTLSKITVPFDLLWNQLQTAAIRGDTETVTRLQGTFKAAALPPDKVVELAAATGLNDAAGRTLFKGLGLNPREIQGAFPIYLVEIYVSVGGKSTEKAHVLMETSPSKDWMGKMPPNSFALALDMQGRGSGKPVSAALAKAGLVTGDERSFGLR